MRANDEEETWKRANVEFKTVLESIKQDTKQILAELEKLEREAGYGR